MKKEEGNLENKENKKIFLIVGHYAKKNIKKIKEKFEKKYNIVFYNIADNKNKTEKYISRREKIFEKIIFCNLNSSFSIAKKIKNFSNDVIGVETLSDKNIKYLANIVPFCPNSFSPSKSSLIWASDKNFMRELFSIKYKKISPKFIKLKSKLNIEEQIKKIEKKLNYPIIVKPTNLASSKLVTKNYHREELTESIKNIYKKISIVQKIRDKILDIKNLNLNVIAEEFMEGPMYSVDGVVDKNGKVTCYKPCYVITGKNKGYDDFFAHTTLLPCPVSPKSIENIKEVVFKAVDSLSLRNSHFHIELIKTEDDGFKIIEIGPRLGGFRKFMYRRSYNIDIFENSILNKINKKINIKKTILEHTAVMKVYPKKEGIIEKIYGKSKVLKLESLVKLSQNYKSKTRVKFAKNGGEPVFIAYLANKERGKLLGDIRKIEEVLKIKIK